MSATPAQAGPADSAARQATATASTSARPAGTAATFNGQPIRDADHAAALIRSFWTPEAMAEAIPAPMPVGAEELTGESTDRPGRPGVPRDEAVPVGPRTTAGVAGPAVGGLAAAPAGARNLQVNASPGVGRVFFTDKTGKKKFTCSAGAINTSKANLLSTAGHCVHPGNGGDNWYTNWVYAPDYHDDYDPDDLWAARNVLSVEGWVDYNYLWWDYAFVTVWPKNGQKLVHVTGGHGISFNQGRNVGVTLLGYPGLPPFDGLSQHFCQGTTNAAGSQRIKIKNCPLNEGASGGPFLRVWNNGIGFGSVNSVMSYRFSGNMYGPYFDDDVADLYNSAKLMN